MDQWIFTASVQSTSATWMSLLEHNKIMKSMCLKTSKKRFSSLKFICVLAPTLGMLGCSQLQRSPDTETPTAAIATETPSSSVTLEDQSQQLATITEQLASLQMSVQALNERSANLATIAHPPKASEAAPKIVAAPSAKLLDKLVVGQLEWIWLQNLTDNLTARVDTGLEISALQTSDQKVYEKDGKRWVRFRILPTEATAKAAREDAGSDDAVAERFTVDVPIERFAKVNYLGSDEPKRMAIVKLPVQLGDMKQVAEFALANGINLGYPVLLGRDFLKDLVVVDVSAEFLQPKFDPSKEQSFILPGQNHQPLSRPATQVAKQTQANPPKPLPSTPPYSEAPAALQPANDATPHAAPGTIDL